MKITQTNMIEVDDWDSLIKETYGRPYNFQQQDGCRDRGIYEISVPCVADDFEAESVSENSDDEQMGVSFAAWIARDPSSKVKDQKYDWELDLYWERNFYPSIEMIANDLHAKGLLEKGTYVINIDW